MALPIRGEWLVTFVAVVETRSFTATAQRLHRTQAAISMQIRQLEAATGAQLLVRERSGVYPNDAGERLLPYARRTADALQEATLLFEMRDALSGPLRVGIPEEYSGTALPLLLRRFQRGQPGLELQVQCASSDRLDAALESGSLDLGILVADDERRQGELLGHDPTWWVMAEGLTLPPDGPLPLVLFDQACWWRQWTLDLANVAGRDWRIAYTSDSVAGVAAALQAGLGVGVLGRSTLPPGVRRVPDELGLPDLPGSHLMLRVANPGAAGAAAMASLMQEHFRLPA